jgi:CRISPR type III-A-associated protein Csm2
MSTEEDQGPPPPDPTSPAPAGAAPAPAPRGQEPRERDRRAEGQPRPEEERDRDRRDRGQRPGPRHPERQADRQGGGRSGRDRGRPGPGGGERRGPPHEQRQPWSKPDFLARAVKEGLDREFIETALELARALGPGISAGQFRSVFGEVLRQEARGVDAARLLLLKPRLAYLAARSGRSEVKELRAVLERGLEAVCAEEISAEEQKERFDRFAQCLEAILSYQRVYERRAGERP